MEVKFKDVNYENSRIILKNINYTFENAMITAIMGPPGCGKSLMIDMIEALVFPTSGEILIDNEVIDNKNKINNINKLRFNVGYVFQYPDDSFFLPTVLEEVSFGLKHYQYKIEKQEQLVSDALKMVGLNDSYLNLNPFSLSHGEKKKVALASVLVTNPKVLLLDEPSIGLDNVSKKQLIKLLIKLKKRYNKTIIIASNDVEFIHKFVDNLVILKNGKILASGKKNDIFSDKELFKKEKIPLPEIIEFVNLVYEKKGIKLDMQNDIRELIKDVYRNV